MLSGRFFEFLHSRFILFNSCWEDPRLDRRALRIGAGDRLAVITSAGCNALEYLLDDPAHIHAVDLNPLQNHLLELKIAGIRTLSWADFFQTFGRGRHPEFPDLYRDALRGELSPAARAWWDSRTSYFTGSRVFPTFYHRGATGMAAKLARGYAAARGIRMEEVLSIFEAGSLEKQSELFEEYVGQRLWTRPLRWALDREAAASEKSRSRFATRP